MAKQNSKDYNFFEDVHAVARLVPEGRVTSYGAIAKYLHTGMSERVVGWAMKAADSVPPRARPSGGQ